MSLEPDCRKWSRTLNDLQDRGSRLAHQNHRARTFLFDGGHAFKNPVEKGQVALLAIKPTMEIEFVNVLRS